MPVKYVFVTGGVVSGLGKGITAASLGRLLKARGYHVTSQKFDPYINIDPGTMNPIQHGEVFVTDDGADTTPPVTNTYFTGMFFPPICELLLLSYIIPFKTISYHIIFHLSL